MSRHLTPAKIGLLALIKLYVEEVVPNDAILPVLSFVASHVIESEISSTSGSLQPTARWDKAESTVRLVISIKDFEKLLASYPVLLGMPGRRLWDAFLAKLWGINSLDSLHEFFECLPTLLAKTREELRHLADLGEAPEEPKTGILISKSSPFGIFIRRSMLEFSRLAFCDASDLWKNFVRYRQPTATYMRRRNPSFNRLSFDHVLSTGDQSDWDAQGTARLSSVVYGDMLHGDHTGRVPVSTDDIETLLEFQIEQMQKYGCRIPLEIRHQFQDLLNDSHIIPSLTHYLSFLDSWRSGDLSTAFDHLHRYFDYTLQNRDRLFYQYALMNLAVLQADFGCHEEAVAAMLESVSTARENRDMTCLNFALNWLFHFGRAHPSLVKDLEASSVLGTRRENLAFLRVKARESEMWSLWAAVLLSETKVGLHDGGSIASAFESTVRGSQVILEKNLKNMFGSYLIILSSVWDRLGLADLRNASCEVFLRCHKRHAIFDDELKLTCRYAQFLTSQGKYDLAFNRILDLDENALRSIKSRGYWTKCITLIRCRRAISRGELPEAEHLLCQLRQSKEDDLEPEMPFLVDTLYVDFLIRRGDLKTAFAAVEEMLALTREENKDIAIRIRLLILKAEIYARCGRPQRGFTIALRAASLAFRARLLPSLWQATGTLGNILISLGDFAPAARLLIAVIPRALECDDAILAARLYTCLADADMGLAGLATPGSTQRHEAMVRASSSLDSAFGLYSSIEDVDMQCEVLAKRATVMNIMGDGTLAAQYAAKYVSLREGNKPDDVSAE